MLPPPPPYLFRWALTLLRAAQLKSKQSGMNQESKKKLFSLCIIPGHWPRIPLLVCLQKKKRFNECKHLREGVKAIYEREVQAIRFFKRTGKLLHASEPRDFLFVLFLSFFLIQASV